MLRRVHRWLGILVAGWLAVVALSGILLLWEDEYYAWRYPQLPVTSSLAAPDPDVIERIVGSSSARITTLGLPTKSLPAYHVYFADGREALYHPRTSDLVSDWGATDSLPAFLFELHAHLFLGAFGLKLVGLLGILALVNIAVGFAMWVRRRRVYRLRFFLPRDLSRPRLARGHAAQGVLLAGLSVVILASGIGMAYAQPTNAMLAVVFGAADTLRPSVRSLTVHSIRTDWRKALAAIETAFPDGSLRYLTPPENPGVPIVARVRNPGELHPNGRSYVVLRPDTGQILERIDATKTGIGPAIGNSLYPIHAGKTGWPGHRLLFALVSASLVFISMIGVYLTLSRPSALAPETVRRGADRRPAETTVSRGPDSRSTRSRGTADRCAPAQASARRSSRNRDGIY